MFVERLILVFYRILFSTDFVRLQTGSQLAGLTDLITDNSSCQSPLARQKNFIFFFHFFFLRLPPARGR